jgi:S1-C subfamily serine protease
MSINIDQFRTGADSRWELPLFSTDLGAGVMPLFVNKDDQLFHIGTAFLISAAGVFATASHCIMEALRFHGVLDRDFEPGKDYDLLNSSVKLSVLHIHNYGEGVRFSIWSVANMQVAHPTDVAFGFLHGVDAPSPVAPARLSFAVPAPDSLVRAIGYPKNDLPPISLEAIREKRFDWANYRPKLVVAEGRVRGTVMQGYGIVKGPCLVTECPTEHGMSGGPVVNQAGDVCGVVSAGATLDNITGSTLSLLHPTLPVGLKVVWTPHPAVALNFGMPLIMAVDRGLVKSDGTENLHRLVADGERFRVDPVIDRQHVSRVFDNAQDFWDERPARPASPEKPPETLRN